MKSTSSNAELKKRKEKKKKKNKNNKQKRKYSYKTLQAVPYDVTHAQEKSKSLPTEIIHGNNKISVTIHDVVIRKHTMRCGIPSHTKIQSVNGSIKLLSKTGRISTKDISLFYCPDCNEFFISEYEYNEVRRLGIVLCRICKDSSLHNHNMEWCNGVLREESILKQFGYTVDSKHALSQHQRQALLGILIDNNVVSKEQVISLLDFFISSKAHNSNYAASVEKWTNDKKYVAGYKIDNHTNITVDGFK